MVDKSGFSDVHGEAADVRQSLRAELLWKLWCMNDLLSFANTFTLNEVQGTDGVRVVFL